MLFMFLPKTIGMSYFSKCFKIICYYNVSRYYKVSSILRCSSVSVYSTAALAPVEWRGALAEAEKAAAFPTSFLDLRKLFNEEVASFAIRLRRLLETNHPMLRSTKYILLGEKSNLQSSGLAVLLVCKLAGYDGDVLCLTSYMCDVAGILNCQRVLAEIVEIKRNWHAIRKTNLLRETADSRVISDDNLAGFCNQYGLKDTGAFELISAGAKDMGRADCVGDRDPGNRPIPSRPNDDNINSTPTFDWEKDEHLLDFEKFAGRAKNEWTFRTMLTSGSILSKGCKAAVRVAKQDKDVQHTAFSLGGHLALSWQLYLDIKDFYFNGDSFSLVGAPVMFAIEEYPEIYSRIEPAAGDYKLVDMRLLNKAVRSTRAIENTKDFLEQEVDLCLKFIAKFNNNEAKDVLKNIILAVRTESMGYID